MSAGSANMGKRFNFGATLLPDAKGGSSSAVANVADVGTVQSEGL